MNIGASIKKLRGYAGISQVELSKKAKLAQGYLSNIERGMQNPSSQVIKRISKVLDIPPGLIVVMSIEDEDVKIGKKRLFKKLKPVMEEIIAEALILQYGRKN
jgi:transcriptional regulator with XRE-family HTH domain